MAQGGEKSFRMEKAKDMIGFVPKYSIDEGLSKIKEIINLDENN